MTDLFNVIALSTVLTILFSFRIVNIILAIYETFFSFAKTQAFVSGIIRCNGRGIAMKVSDSQHRLRELMEYYGINQQNIADRTGLGKSVISLYINGKREPRQDKISLICDAYNADPAWLMGHDVPMQRRDSAKAAEQHFSILEKYLKLSPRDQEIVESMIDSMLAKKS